MQEHLEDLSSFDASARSAALARLLAAAGDAPARTRRVNMHLHTFFSFNGEGYSPSRLAWDARQQGLYAAAICDFDVLAGLDEFLHAGDLLDLRVAVGFESRVFFAEYAADEVNSPGEPGILYFMGMGFVRQPPADSASGKAFADMLSRSHGRNRALIARINEQLSDVTVDYDTDVLPLTPRGNATERHIVRAYHNAVLQANDADRAAAAVQWASLLGVSREQAVATMADANSFLDLLRSKLMKRGGLGYIQPTETTFPLLDDVIRTVKACRAIPMTTWLDGMSAGESDPEKQLECLKAKGAAAVNIIPDRNWNFTDSDEQRRKVAELTRYVAAADALELPINVGTELNKPGQRFVDDFEAAPMKPFLPTFMRGAQVMIGHTRLLRYADFSYVGEAACAEYPEVSERNAFFAGVGDLPCPGAETRRQLEQAPPEKAYALIQDSLRAGHWIC